MTEYVKMLLASNKIPPWWGRAAHIFSWILLQGYVIFPGTFNAFNLSKIDSGSQTGESPGSLIREEFFYIVRHVPIFWIGWSAVIIGGLGMFYCLLRWRRNYVWGLREVISPGLYAASTGLVSTVSNIWGAPEPPGGYLNGARELTLFVTGGATVFFSILWLLYKPILIGNAEKTHINEVGNLGLGKYGEGRIQEKEFVEGKGTRIANMVSGQLVS